MAEQVPHRQRAYDTPFVDANVNNLETSQPPVSMVATELRF
jgi:hypothetical protein